MLTWGWLSGGTHYILEEISLLILEQELIVSNNHCYSVILLFCYTVIPIFGTIDHLINLWGKTTGKRIGYDFCPSVVGDVNLITCIDSLSFE